MSDIEWTDQTWNPLVGCTRHSAACDNCYAITMATRVEGMERNRPGHAPHYRGVVANGDWTGLINRAPDHIFNKPLRTRKPTVWFVNSMSDVFHENVPDDLIRDVFAVMNATPHHQYQVLTKRPKRMADKVQSLGLKLTSNIWMGASVGENKFARPTVRELKRVKAMGASVVFISAEPLLEPLPDLDVGAVDWVITGGESGTSRSVRPMGVDWARDLRDRCKVAGTPFFFKQWGSHDERGRKVGKETSGSLLDGEIVFQMPASVYDAMPRRNANWSKVRLNRETERAEPAQRPTDRMAASSYPYVTPERPLDTDHDALIARLSDEEVFLNANYRPTTFEIDGVRSAIIDGHSDVASISRATKYVRFVVEKACEALTQKRQVQASKIGDQWAYTAFEDDSFIRLAEGRI